MQQRAPKGGIKKLTLQSNKIYSVDDVIRLGTSLFTSPFAKDRLEKSDVKLGCYSTDIIFDSFSNDQGAEIGILDYFDFVDIGED